MTPKQLGEQPAFPSEEVALQGTPFQKVTTTPGLTKREEFAKAALQGLLADPQFRDAAGTGYKEGFQYGRLPYEPAAGEAVKYADALIAALQSPPK